MNAQLIMNTQIPSFVGLKELPPVELNDKYPTSRQIAVYLKKLLDKYTHERKDTAHVIVPSVLNLAGFFHCSELHILEALQELGRFVYDYEMTGLDCPIHLKSCQHHEDPHYARTGINEGFKPWAILWHSAQSYKRT
jgi:hypothetical protein